MAFALTPLTARLAVLVGAIDMPGRRKTHADRPPAWAAWRSSAPSPRCGPLPRGWFGVSLPRELSLGLIAGACRSWSVSVLDDMRGGARRSQVPGSHRRGLIAVASGVALGAVVHLFDVAIQLGVWAMPLSVLWMVGVTNAFNMIDGLDGLSAGLALIASLSMAAVFALVGQPTDGRRRAGPGGRAGRVPAVTTCIPARLFLGDTGATAIGFCLAAFALKGGSTLSAGSPRWSRC